MYGTCSSSLRFHARLLVVFGLLLLAWPVMAACSGAAPPASQRPTPSPEPPLRIAGTRKALPALQKVAEAYRRSQPAASFQFDLDIESLPAIREVAASTLDLALSSRRLSGAETPPLVVQRTFVRDAIVFAANASAAVPGVSSAHIRAIYGGRVTNWEQLGGAAGPIIVLDREASDSSHQQVLLKVLDGTSIGARTAVYYSSEEMLDALETTPGALGYSALGLLRQRQPRSVQVLALDGVTPNAETLTSGVYPWLMPFYLVHRADPSPALDRFLGYLWGPDGRRVLEEYGYGAATD